MTNLAFLFFTYFIEALVLFYYCKSIYKPKINSWFSFFIALISYFALMIIFKYVINIEIINAILMIITNITVIKIAFLSSFRSSVFHSLVLCILRFISEFIATYLLAITYNSSSQTILNDYFETGVILCSILYFLFSRIVVKLSLKETQSKSWGKWVLLSVLPVCSIMIILVFRMFTNNIVLSVNQNIICISSIAFLLIVNIIVYMIYEQAEGSNQKLIELELVNQKNEIDMQYLELLEKKNETMNIMAHDYKNNILTIFNMSDSNEVKEYINNMVGEIAKYNRIAKTQNRLLDVILSKYTDICNDKGIKFETDIMTDNLGFINSYDISSLFNNILDNAVEAASLSSNKYINLEITNSLNSYHRVTATNSCDNEPHNEKGKLITTKKNIDAHGFGTKSIRKIVNKYDGELQWEYNNELRQFKLIIIFPNEQ
ncbi:sensor histidine kinase [uncultured Eubacterium sp.]|uniref:sensor histidine kinase n=1 Tax=uncultured Eubacterium sp. TaxID=165185 RepID=UPI0025EA2137|nr:sensor histidine kinase [uncultured Eubacterium sp.]